ncbi:MAG: polysaccharide biosynthesis protein, partial [Clostridia bacterium]|nr:polysaccharide biosynthesis protein [Clostridia bacterium]
MVRDPSVEKNGKEAKNSQNIKRLVREFEIEELLFRHPVRLDDEKTNGYYKDKVVMITGGGGSIGSELCRQIAKMQPRSLIILDVYENGTYDIQQELKISCEGLDLHVKIVSICDRAGMERTFRVYRP